MEAVIFTEEQLKTKCVEWQKVLRLQDWDVKTSIKRARDMNLDANGVITVHLEHRLASIRILDPLDYSPEELHPQDMEKILVHELLHIHLFPMTKDYEGHLATAEEQAINMITSSLIELSRRGGETKNEKGSDLR
ncbi:hypothetical protein [Paenibacillus sp. P32E]|uniref:hypothetical protein n=1 Tax=Paenibacillus sp. P32E TaxID=1349434 RepID=UPI00093A2D33|nr:hypothetical protein [Paenibacillus sp. P32E]OKP91318.1 hypothetical protein A3848_09425 [Paenibacillus sp. P32E]